MDAHPFLAARREVATGSTAGVADSGHRGSELRRMPTTQKFTFKPLLCRDWLAAAATKLRIAASQQSCEQFVASIAHLSCPRGASCPYAHGVMQLALPTADDVHVFASRLMFEHAPAGGSYGSYASDSTPYSSSTYMHFDACHASAADAASHLSDSVVSDDACSPCSGPGVQGACLTFHEQNLLLLASTLMVPLLPSPLQAIVQRIQARSGAASSLTSIASEAAHLPLHVARALTLAGRSSILSVSMSSRSQVEARRALELSRIVAIVGHDACNAAICTAAAAIQLIPLPSSVHLDCDVSVTAAGTILTA